MSQHAHAPWSAAQVDRLSKRQANGMLREYTSQRGIVLIPTVAGWVEELGGPVVQTWAHAVDAGEP